VSAPERPPNPTDEQLEALLGRGRLGDRTRQRVLDDVLARVAGDAGRRSAPPRQSRWRWRALLAMAAAGGAVAAVVTRGVPSSSLTDRGFRARGASAGATTAGAYVLDLGCSNGALDRCPLGSTLVFRAQIAPPGGYLLGYADPIFAGGQRIWYFAGPGAPLLAPSDAPRMVARGVRLAAGHAPGAYAVHLLVARRPLREAEVLAPAADDVIATRVVRLVVAP